MFKKKDIIIFALIAVMAAVGFIVLNITASKGKTVVVKKNNKTVFTGSIFIDKTVDLKSNVVTIKNKEVFVEYANCKNQICVKHKKISKAGEVIVCLPNKVIVEIK